MMIWKSRTFDQVANYGSADPIIRPVTAWVSDVVEHGLRDDRGRAIGNFARIESFQKLIRRDDGVWALATEVSYFVTTQATRDGKMFGASSVQHTECGTLEEAQALAAKKITAAGKRFARQFAKRVVA